MRRIISGGIIFLILLAACQKEQAQPGPESDEYVLQVPAGFPVPDIPADNALTKSRVTLGRLLFYDPALSADSTLACASCHFQQFAFSDTVAFSNGIQARAGTRNVPSLANVAYQKKLLREGSVPTLEMQVLVPIQEHNEFDFNILLIEERLRKIPRYVELAQKAYGRQPDPFVITRAISAFERTLLSGDSPYDRYTFQGDNQALTASAKRGLQLFESERLNCRACHTGFLFSSQEFANNGLYEVYADPGRFRFTGLESDRAVFKIPGLRNVALTAPYMHDGSLKTLDAVIEHYQSGGKAHPNKSARLKPFTLTAQERSDLLAFLNSLSDQTFIHNPAFTHP